MARGTFIRLSLLRSALVLVAVSLLVVYTGVLTNVIIPADVPWPSGEPERVMTEVRH